MQNIRVIALGAALVLGATTVGAQQPANSGTAQPRAERAEGRQQGPRADRAQGPRMRGMQGRALAGRGPLFEGITLSEAQQSRLDAIGERYRPQFQALMPRERRTQGQARPDSAARAQRVAQVQALRQRQEAEVRGVLTADQQRTFDANRTRLAERARELRAERGEGKRPGAARQGRARTGARGR